MTSDMRLACSTASNALPSPSLFRLAYRLLLLPFYLQETAINIGYACSLITDDMTQFQMQGACLETDKLEAEGRVSRAWALLGQFHGSEHACLPCLCQVNL